MSEHKSTSEDIEMFDAQPLSSIETTRESSLSTLVAESGPGCAGDNKGAFKRIKFAPSEAGGSRRPLNNNNNFESGFPQPGGGGSFRNRTQSSATSALSPQFIESIENMVDDDGTVSMQDLAGLIEHQATMKSQYSQLKKLSAIFIGLLLFFGVAGGYAAYKMNQNLKDSSVNGDVLISKKTRQPVATASVDTNIKANVMTSKATGGAVEVASVDTTIAMDGTLLSRDGSGAVVSTSVATTHQTLSSLMSDDALRELRVLALTSPTGASIHLNVLGFTRLPPRPCRRTLVKIITAAGVLMLDGTSLTFDTDVAGVFADAGFESSNNPDNHDGAPAARRRLLQSDLSSLIGMFNMVGRFSDSELYKHTHPDTDKNGDCDGGVVSQASGNFKSLSDRYRITAKGYILCHLPSSIASLKNETDWCHRMGAKPHTSVDGSSVDGLYFTEDITITHDGKTQRSVGTKSVSWDAYERVIKEVQDKQMGIVKSASILKNDKMYDCTVSQLPKFPSIFDGMQMGTMRREKLEMNGRVGGEMEELWVVDLDSVGNKDLDLKPIPESQVEFELHLRVWQTKSGLWRRFQVTDSRQWSIPTESRPLTWTWEKFYDVTEIVQLPSFAGDTFTLNFIDANDRCMEESAKLPPLELYPSHLNAAQYRQMLAVEGEQMSYWSADEDLTALNKKMDEIESGKLSESAINDVDNEADTTDDTKKTDDAAATTTATTDAPADVEDDDKKTKTTENTADAPVTPRAAPKFIPQHPNHHLIGPQNPDIIHQRLRGLQNPSQSRRLLNDQGHTLLEPSDYMTEENVSDVELEALLAKATGGADLNIPNNAQFFRGMRAALSEALILGADAQRRHAEAAADGRRSTAPTSFTVAKSGTYDEEDDVDDDFKQPQQQQQQQQQPRRSKSDRTGIVNPHAQWHPDDCEQMGGEPRYCRRIADAHRRRYDEDHASTAHTADDDVFDDDDVVDEDAPAARKLLRGRGFRRRRLPGPGQACTFRSGLRGRCLSSCRGGQRESGHCSGSPVCCVRDQVDRNIQRNFGVQRVATNTRETQACRSFNLRTFGLTGQVCGSFPNIASGQISGTRENIPLSVVISGHITAGMQYTATSGISGQACFGLSVGAGAFGWTVARLCGSYCEMELVRTCLTYSVRPLTLTLSVRFGPSFAHGTIGVSYVFGQGQWQVTLTAEISTRVWSGSRQLLNRSYG